MKNQKWISILVIAVGVIAAVYFGLGSRNLGTSSSAAPGDIPSDAVTASGTAQGMEGPVTVEVTATKDKIYAIKVTEQNETKDIGTKAVDQLPAAIFSANSLEVDGVSGATITSNAIKEAAAAALTSAGLDPASFGYTKAGGETKAASEGTAKKEIPADAVKGTGTAKGNNGDVTVEVTMDADNIYDVKVTKHQETEGIGTKAIEQVPPEIIEGNTTKVDTVSGATVTSNAIIEAVKAAIKDAGFDPAKFDVAKAANKEKAEDVSYDTDVVIVGAGGAGMVAAIEAADAGKNVILVESQTMVGGNSIRATGGLNAAKTKWQDANEFNEGAGVEAKLKTAREKYADNKDIQTLADTVEKQWAEYQAAPNGYFDSPELFELDTMIGGKGKNDFTLVKTLVENSSAAIDWLDSIGAEMHNVGSFGGASVKRIHRPVNAEGKTTAVGAYMVPILEKNVNDRKNIQVLFSTTADKILMDASGQKAVGIHATGETGNNVTINAGSVVITTGGFGANLDMVTKYRPDLKGFMTTNAAGAQGQGIDMATAVGAATVDMDQIQIHPTVEANTAHLITEGLRGDGAILVNQDGKRFVDEVGTRDVVSAAEIAQPGSYSWLIVDQKMVDASAVIQGYIKSGYTKQGDDYKALAKELEIDPDTLDATINTWNGYVAQKSDPDFNRTSFASPLDTAPYYAIKVTAGIHHTMGGIKIDKDTEVLKENGTPIGNLYAAGEVTGGVHGANRLGGNAVADFTVFGRIAGQHAAANLGTAQGSSTAETTASATAETKKAA
jgi:fumarate reductase flavoprotein subunit